MFVFYSFMLRVNKFTVNRNVIKNPQSSQVREVLTRIFEDDEISEDAFALTKAIASVLPKEKALSCWPHVDLEGFSFVEFRDPAYIFDPERLKSFGTDITEVLNRILDSCISKRKFKPDQRDNLKNVFNYLFNNTRWWNVLGTGMDREKGFCRQTKVLDAGKYAIKVPSYNYKWQYEPDLTNWVFMSQKYRKLKTYKGSVLLKTKDLKIMENVGEHQQAGISSFNNYSDKVESYNYYINTYLKDFSAVPQKSFDDVALDFATLNRDFSKDGKYTNFAFENPNNIILKDGKLYLVDELIEEHTEPNTTADYLFNMLSIVHQFDMHNHVDYAGSMPYAKTIFKKILKSSALAQLPPVPSGKRGEYILEQVLGNFKINVPVEDVVMEFGKINKIQDKVARVKTMEKYADKLLNNN